MQPARSSQLLFRLVSVEATSVLVQALVDAHHALWGTERIGADEKAMSTRTGRPLTD